MRFLSVLASLAAFPFVVSAEPPVSLDCTIQYWNEHSKKEKDHDYQHGYSTTKIALIAAGAASVVVGVMALPDKEQLGHSAICYGAVSVGVGVIIAIGFWLVRRLSDGL